MGDMIQLLDMTKSGGYEASVITTYNAFLPFYEEVVLKRLRQSGCQNNIVLMDEKELKKSLIDEHLRPKYAGFEYTLIPVRASGVFHPKITMLAGPKKGLLYIGSHNLTLSGFGRNREQTAEIRYQGKKGEEVSPVFSEVVNYLQSWFLGRRGNYPDEVLEKVLSLSSLFPWMNTATNDPKMMFLGQGPSGPCLWDQLRPLIQGTVNQVNVIGPFFDQKLEFLRRVSEDLKPKSMVVGIDPSTVDIPRSFSDLDDASFKNTKELCKPEKDSEPKKGYLHAKTIYFKVEGGDDILVTGSANPSSPAWLAGQHGNGEAVLVIRGEDLNEQAKSFDVDQLEELPSVRPEEIESQQTEKNDPRESPEPPIQVVYGLVKEGIVTIQKVSGLESTIKRGMAVGNLNSIEIKPEQLSFSDNELVVDIGSDLINELRFIQLETEVGSSFHIIVHHTDELDTTSNSGMKGKLKKGCEALWLDTPEIESLMGAVEKCIFYSHINIRKRRQVTHEKAVTTNGSEEHGSLIVEVQDSETRKLHSRIVDSCDISALFELLSKSLSTRRNEQGSPEVKETRNEEELVGSDDEIIEDEEALRQQRLTSCHKWVSHLVNKTKRKLKETCELDREQQTLALIQLLGVLRFFQELRYIEGNLDWVHKGETLIPVASRSKMLEVCLEFLFGWGNSLFEKVRHECNEDKEELTQLLSTVTWLYWDSHYAIKKQFLVSSARKDKEILLLRSRHAKMMLHLHQTAECQEKIATDFERLYSPNTAQRAGKWLKESLEATETLRKVMDLNQWPEASGIPRVGNFVMANRRAEDQLLWKHELLMVTDVSSKNVKIAEKKPRKDDRPPVQSFPIGSVRIIKA